MASLLELARKLHRERLFIRSEREAIHQLNKQIRLRSEKLSHVFWTTRQHHLNLNHFITNSSQSVPATCSLRATQLDNVKFVDAYKELGYQETMYASFLHAFRSNPTLAAACLAYAEKLGLGSTVQVVQSVVLGIYGNSIISGDHRHLLELMETLLLLQLANEDQPRRVMHKGNAAFCIVFRLFTESSLAGRLFLTSALHQPIMQVLMADELYLECDSRKILDCFSQVDIEKKFGKQDDPEFQDKVKRHLKGTEDKFFEICQSFIDGLHAAMFCFPQSMGWVIARAYHIVKEAGLVTPAEARALCSDLMLQMFISPAIVTPELYGVTGDAPISEFTRFNLMQIAQTLQILALRDGDAQSDSTFYSRFEKNCMNSLLDAVIDTWHTDGVPTAATSEHKFKECSVFLTCSQLAQLIQLLREIQHSDVRGVDQSSLAEILSHVPDNPPPALVQAVARRESSGNSSQGDAEDAETKRNSSIGSAGSTGHPSPMPHRANESHSSASGVTAKKLFSKTTRYSTPDESKSQAATDGPDVVLVISLTGVSGTSADPPGMLSENEVLEMHACNENIAGLNSEPDMARSDVNALNDVDSERMDKRLRFSHYSTDYSELDGGTEAISSSTSGSLMDDIDPAESVPADDTSSFRGTSSHGNQDEDLEMEEGDLESVPHTNNDEALKALERKLPTSRESIEDKMRKFEIRSQLGVRFGGAVVAGLGSDEGDRAEAGHGTSNYLDTRSETWSTDVYASDSETPTEQGDPPEQPDRLQEIAENPERGQMRSSTSGPYLALLPRDEDARSDVWSVEVLPSDSEPPDVKPEDRLQELESESNAGHEDAIDPMDDVRSRASTPSLSAASGVSGTSGMSLVSDNIHAKDRGEEHGSSSEKSFRKTPSSISPDADDMTASHRGHGAGPHSSGLSGAGSSHSSGSGEGAASNARQHFGASAITASSMPLDGLSQSIGAGGSDHDFTKKTNNSSKRNNFASPAGRISSERKPMSPVSMPSGANHLNWPERAGADGRRDVTNRRPDLGSRDSPRSPLVNPKPETASTPDPESAPGSSNTNTIKRSPYKHNDAFTTDKASSAFNSVPVSLARDVSIGAHGDGEFLHHVSGDFVTPTTTTTPLIGYVKVNGKLPGSFQGSSSVTTSSFVPISSAAMHSPSPPSPHDISLFDPLAPAASIHSGSAETRAQPKKVSIGNNLLNMNSMSAALVDLSTEGESSRASHGVDQQSQIPSPVSASHGRKQHKHGVPKRNSVDHDARGVERKKSWWKSPRLPVLSSKRKTFRMSASLQSSKEELVNGDGDVTDSYLKPASDNSNELPKPLEPNSALPFPSDTPGEDIMEKYMRKAASNQSSPKMSHVTEVPVPSAAEMSSSSHRNDAKSFLDETILEDKTLENQNPNNSSSNTDPQSTPSNISSSASEQTVTMVAPEPWSNLSPPLVLDRPARAVPSGCLAAVAKEAEYTPDSAQSIADAQRKLRLMLAMSESFPESSPYSGILPRMAAQPFAFLPDQQRLGESSGPSGSRGSMKVEIITFLKLQLAEAVSLQDHSRIAQIHETKRCVQVLDGRGCKEVLQNLWREYKQRSTYVAYLVRTKEALLSVSSYLQHVFRCTQRDQETCRRYFTTVSVNLFLKRMEASLRSFRSQFTLATAADEKVALVHRFLSYLYGQMSRDGIWESASEEQLQEAERAVERSVFVYIYKQAIYPNGDGDVMRDQLFQEHITRLGEVVTSQHPALLIPKKYLNECPWTSAQAEVRSLNAYKTPRDKLAAVLRCCSTIMNLLKMADEGMVPGADDFTPVLVYVLIKANPVHLLSTVQYITSFLGDHLTGEDSYWWMQFTAATEFIKTIDERK